jgi:hypothetical protein
MNDIPPGAMDFQRAALVMITHISYYVKEWELVSLSWATIACPRLSMIDFSRYRLYNLVSFFGKSRIEEGGVRGDSWEESG